MRFPFHAEPATFLARPNRFRVVARLHTTGEVIAAHCADPGRLRELLIPNGEVTVFVSPAVITSAGNATSAASSGVARKTAYDLRFVRHPETGQLVSLDTRVPNQIVAEALTARALPPFAGLTSFAREVPAPFHTGAGVHSRFDFCGQDADGRTCWIEVKSVTLVEDGVARFPDAVTARGRRHLLELIDLQRRGDRAAVFFVVQRSDARWVEAHRGTDPAFADALQQAAAAEVELYAWTLQIGLTEATLANEIQYLQRASKR